jgi:hypothetical protein
MLGTIEICHVMTNYLCAKLGIPENHTWWVGIVIMVGLTTILAVFVPSIHDIEHPTGIDRGRRFFWQFVNSALRFSFGSVLVTGLYKISLSYLILEFIIMISIIICLIVLPRAMMRFREKDIKEILQS